MNNSHLYKFQFEELSSTMDFAQELRKANFCVEAFQEAQIEEKPCPEVSYADKHYLILANAQTKGRGREQRTWISEKDKGIYLSYSFLLQKEARISGLSLVVGLTIYQALKEFDVQTTLKWPNDVLVPAKMVKPLREASDENQFPQEETKEYLSQEKQVKDHRSFKLAGILLEVTSNQDTYVVIGMGLNLKKVETSSNNKYLPISIEELISGDDLYNFKNLFLAEFLKKLFLNLELFFAKGFTPFQEDWLRASMMKGKVIQYLDSSNKIQIAKVKGISDQGGLIVDTMIEDTVSNNTFSNNTFSNNTVANSIIAKPNVETKRAESKETSLNEATFTSVLSKETIIYNSEIKILDETST